MVDVEQARQETRAISDVEPEFSFDYITDDLLAQLESDAETSTDDVQVVTSEGGTASVGDVESEIVETTRTYYGNHVTKFPGLPIIQFATNGAGQPCGTGFRVTLRNWRTASVTNAQWCPGGFWGSRITVTY